MANLDEQGDCTRGLVSCLLGAGLLLNGSAIYCYILDPTFSAHHKGDRSGYLLTRIIEAGEYQVYACVLTCVPEAAHDWQHQKEQWQQSDMAPQHFLANNALGDLTKGLYIM